MDKRTIKQLVINNGFKVIDGRKISIDPKKEEERSMYMEDGLHPNAHGHRKYADIDYLHRFRGDKYS